MPYARFASFGACMLAIATALMSPLAAANFDQSRPYHQGAALPGENVCTTVSSLQGAGCTFQSPGDGTGDNNVQVTLSDDLIDAPSFEVTSRSGGNVQHEVCHRSCLIERTNIAEVTVRLYPAWLNEDSFVDCHLGDTLVCVPPTQGTITLHWFD